MARRRQGLHHGRTVARRARRQGRRPLRLGHRHAPRPRLRFEPRPDSRRPAARDRRVFLVGRREEAPPLHQHEEGLAAEHARRLLGPRPRDRPAAPGRRGQARVDADVRQVLAGRHPGRLRPGQRPLGRRPRLRPDHEADLRRQRDDHQRHGRLGLRGGVRHPRRLPLEPERARHRLLALRRQRHRRLPAHRRHRHALPGRHAHPLSQGRHHELGGEDRNRRRRAAARRAGSSFRATRGTCTWHAWSTSTSRARS